MRFLIALFTLSLWSTLMVGQTGNCGDPSPLCILPTFDYPIANNVATVPGDYGCIERANPPNTLNGYFYVEIRSPGAIVLDFTSQNALSVAAWGPFASVAAAASTCGALPPPFSCDVNDSFSSASTTITINGQVGDFFLIYVEGAVPPAFTGQFSVRQIGQGTPGSGVLACNGFNNVTIGCLPSINLTDCNEDVPDPVMTAFDFVNAGGNLDVLCTNRVALTVQETDNGALGCPGDQRIVERRYSVQDQCGNIGSCLQQITYPILQGPLELFCPPSNAPSQLVTCLDDLEVNVQDIIALDGCGIELSFDIGEPAVNVSSLGMECDLTCLHYPITVTDECGRVGECTLSFTVYGNAPVFVNDIDETGLECRIAPLDIDCKENIDSTIENWLDTLSVFSTCGNSTNLTTNFDQDNLVSVCDGDIAQTQEITITAKDDCGRTNSCTATINIIKTEAPSIAAEAKDKWVTCSQNVDSIFQAYLADNGGAIAIDFCTATTFTTNPADPQVFISCGDEPGLSIEFIVSDICGNTATTVGVFKVMNDGDISLSTPAADVTVACGDDAANAFSDFLDNQSGAQAVACGNVVWTTDPENPMLPTIDDVCNEASTTVTFTATDECGQQISTTATFTIEDNLAPTISDGEDLDLICGEDTEMQIETWLADNGSLTISDECSDVMITNDYDAIDLGNICHDEPIVVTFTATDACGNESTQTLEINITDTTPPVFTFIPTSIDEAAIAEDECSEVTITTMDVMNGGQIIRTYTATDACGNSTSVTVTFGEVDNEPPVIIFIPTELGPDGTLNPDDIIATDNNGPVTITVVLISQTGSCGTGFTTVYEVTATDEAGNATIETVTFNVPADNEPPVITNVPTNLTFTCSDGVTIPEPTVNDNVEVVSLTCVETLNDGAVTDNCNNGFGYDITKVWTATDACGNTSTAVTLAWVVPDDYTGPRFVFVPEDNVMECGDNTTFGEAICTTDCGNVVLTFEDQFLQGDCNLDGQMIRTWTGLDDCGNVATAQQVITIPADTEAPVFTYIPESKTIDNINELVFGTPNCVDNCATINHLDIDFVDSSLQGACGFVRTWTVSDLCGNAAQASQTFTINDNEAPVIDETTFLIEQVCGFTVDFTSPNIYDNLGQVDIVITDTQLEENCTGLPEFTRTWTASDMCGNVSSFTQTKRTVDTEAPVISGVPSDLVLTCGEEILTSSISVTAVDECDMNVELRFEEVQVAVDDCSQSFMIVRTWTAMDDCGNASSAIQKIEIRDDTPPVLIGVPDDLVLTCGIQIPNPAIVTAVDDCDMNVEILFEEVQVEGDDCSQSLMIVRTWTAMDDCGNSATAIQKIEVIDNTAPVLVGVPSDIVLTCVSEIPSPANVAATDDCDADVEILLEESIVGEGNCSQSTSIVRTWTATDDCGNMSTISQRIELLAIDNEAPILEEPLTALMASCGEEVVFDVPNFVDDCSAVDILIIDTIESDDCDQIHVREWTAVDACGNATSTSQTITLIDNVAPVLSGVPSDQVFTCGDEIPSLSTGGMFVTAVDDCDINVEVSAEEVIVNGDDCSESTVLMRIWTATDDCGNMSTFSQRIEIASDIEAPELLSTLENLEMTYDAFLAWTAPAQLDAVDNCSEISQVMTTSENQDCENYVITYNYNLTDACGNNTEATFEVLVTDATPSFEWSIVSDVVCGEVITIDVLELSALDLELDWDLNDASGTWEIINITEDQIEILAGENTAELTLTVENKLGCAVTQSQNIDCSIVNSVQDLTAVSSINLAPNPVSHMLNVNFESNQTLSASIIVYDLLGRTIYQSKEEINVGQNQFDINAKNFETGTYLLEIATEQGSKIEKFMKF